MPTLEAGPFEDLIPATDLIGGENSAPAYQIVGGRFSEVPQAEVNTPTALGAFADLIPKTNLGSNGNGLVNRGVSPFDDLIPKPESDTEKALAETPVSADPLIQLEKGVSNMSGMPIHEAMNAVRVFGSAAGRYIFNGLQGFELNRAKLLANPTPEMVQPQGDEIILPDGSAMSKEQQQALEDHYTRESQAGVPAALANAEYFKLRAEGADEQSFVDPELSNTIPARLAGAAGQAAIMGMETLIPGAGIPLLVMHGALATEAEARNSGKSEAEAEAAGVRSAIGLAIFGGASKLASLGVAKLLPSVVRDPSKLTTFIAQFTGQETANEASSRAIAGWNAAAEAPEGQKVQAAIEAMKDTTLEQTTLNAVFAVMGASKAAGRSVRPATVSEPRPAIMPKATEIRPQGVGPVAGLEVKRARIKELRAEVEAFGQKEGLTKSEAEKFEKVMAELSGLRFDLQKPLTLEKVGSESDRQSTLSAETVLTARNDLMRDKKIYAPISEAAAGSFFGAETRVDKVVTGKDATVSPEQFYTAFTDTRSALRNAFGDTMTLFRAVGKQKSKATTNWATTEAYARQFGDKIVKKVIPVDNILAVNVGPSGKYHEIIVGIPPKPEPEIQRRNAPTPKEPINVPKQSTLGLGPQPRGNESLGRARESERVGGEEQTVPRTAEANAAQVRGEVSETVIPENLRRNPEIDRLINEPAEQTGPQIKFSPATEGGAFGFGGGKRTTVTPKGTTPRGDTEFLRIEPPLKRAFKGLERKGAADVIGETKNKVGKLLAEATTKHVDTEQELFGQISTELIRPITSVSKATAEKAFDEAAVYFAAKENGRPLPALSPAAKGLVTGWENIAERTGQIAAANGVQVFDPATNTHRPMHVMGRQYVPRMFKSEVERVMRDPNSNPRLWNDLVDELALHRGITDVEAANQLRAEAGRFSSNDFMGNLEMARTGKMPESFYEYDLRNLAAKYIPNFSERMSQIIAYGQRLGPRENPQRPNLWDIARKEAGDSYTQDWLNNAENQAVNLRQKGTAATGMARAQTAASGLLLSSPTTTVMRNLLSGTSATPELLGVRRSMKGFADTIKSSQARMDAREIGTVRDNIADFLHADRLQDSPVDNAIRSVVDAGLKYSGYNGSEVFVRTHGTATASQFAKDAVAAINKNPASMRSKEALGLFKRSGVSPEKIVAENADWKSGPETRKFIRTFVRDTQGGYRVDQVPLWANSNMGRFFYQFGRWGTQRARNIWKNGIQPALGEEVQWHGKTMTRRDIRPLAKMLGTTVVVGETFAGIAQLLFGRDRRDASLSEIAEAWKEDEKTAVGLAFERVINDVIMAGTLGIWSQPVDWAKGLKNQTRLKNPTEPPGLGSINSVMELGQAMLDQDGQVTKRDLLKFASSFAPGAKQVTDVARNVMDEPLYEAENDVRTLRNAAHRWAESAGMDVSPKAKGNFRKSAMAPDYEPIKEALLVGDSERAKFLANSFLDQQPNRSQALKNLRSSIRNSQPFRAGPYTAKVHRDNFREWARKNLSEQDWQQAERIQERYMRSANAALLW